MRAVLVLSFLFSSVVYAGPTLTKEESEKTAKSMLMAKALSTACPFNAVNQETVDFMITSLAPLLTLNEAELAVVGKTAQSEIIEMLKSGKDELCAKYEAEFEYRAKKGR